MWYYSENGEQRGPVTDADLEALVQTGKIDSETLVWREGQGDWQPYRTVKPGPTGTPPPVPPFPAGDGVICAECGKPFPAAEVIQFSGVNVCAGCKPIFIQKLKEGVKVGSDMDYASFGLRFGAYILDAIILCAVAMVVNVVVGLMMGTAMVGAAKGGQVQPLPGFFIMFQFVLMAFNLLLQLAYQSFFLGKFGATPGKMACGIKVVNGDGSPVSYAKGAARVLGYLVSGCPTLCIGFLMMLWDDQKRTLHDRMCDTRVIRK
jgi:uncharacterized RDD family membrane protein YckC